MINHSSQANLASKHFILVRSMMNPPPSLSPMTIWVGKSRADIVIDYLFLVYVFDGSCTHGWLSAAVNLTAFLVAYQISCAINAIVHSVFQVGALSQWCQCRVDPSMTRLIEEERLPLSHREANNNSDLATPYNVRHDNTTWSIL